MATGKLETAAAGVKGRGWRGWLGWLGVVFLRVIGPGAVVAGLVYMGALVAGYKVSLIKDIVFIGHSDDAAYVSMAQSLVNGEGLNVHYITYFFIPYPEGVAHREDHWPPFMGFAIAPFFYFMGVSPWVSKLAPILIGSIGLPVLTAALGMAYSRRGYVGLVAGLMMMGNLAMFGQSMRTQSDVPAAMLVAGFCWALIASRRYRWMHVVAGIFAALAFYAKGSEIVLLGLMPVAWMLIADKAGWVSLYAVGGVMAVVADYVMGYGVGAMVAWAGVVAGVNLAVVAGWGWARKLKVKRLKVKGEGEGAKLKVEKLKARREGWGGGDVLLAGMQVVAALLGLGGYWWTREPLVLVGWAGVAMMVAGLPGLFETRWFWVGLGTTVLLLAPWWYSNWRLYGNPLHSTQNYVSGYMGLEDWETGSYSVYWGRGLPKTSDRWEKYGDEYWRYVAANREFYARCALLGAQTSSGEAAMGQTDTWEDLGPWGVRARNWLLGRPTRVSRWEEDAVATRPVAQWQDPVTAVPGVAAVGTAALLGGVTPVGIGAWWVWRKVKVRKLKVKGEGKGANVAAAAVGQGEYIAPWLLGPTLALLLIAGVQYTFMVMLWGRLDMERLTFVFLPILAVIGCTGVSRVVELPVNVAAGVLGWKWPRLFAGLARYWHVPVTVAAVLWTVALVRRNGDWLVRYQVRHTTGQMGMYPYTDQPESAATGKWIGKHIPNAVFMSRNPWEIRFYAAATNQAVALPVGTAAEIFGVCKYYHVTHLVYDRQRYSLQPFVNAALGMGGGSKGLKWVSREAGGSLVGEVFEIDYEALKREGVLTEEFTAGGRPPERGGS